ncbi:multidrug effflux MFS transporter [Siccirubricoccus sp. G192]|uniref:multidrug effflux MFS transporter n=1 Tax=Siccirubricoccus sp. G192 TaxID=2849651 RepID=UPI001C2B8DBA|nr:multidrug effflux MFS transporter [Siccirubricoccus sp. G192]MBV1798801.1 multidrug effflux MFS transporter [Siccirubricoccus sp. G192]
MRGISLSVIILLGALTAIGPISTDIYLPSFPALGAEFGASPAAVQRTLAASFLGMALGQVVYGPLSDRLGRRLPLCIGMGVFALASVGCALADGILGLTWLRLMQALGGCAGLVIGRAVVRDLAEGAAMLRLMSQLMLVFALAPILGPLLGGWLVTEFGWRSVFWLLAGYGVALALAIALLLPESLPPEHRQHGGLAEALRIYLRLLRDRRFLGSTFSGTLPMGGLFAYIAGSPFVFMQLHGVPPERYGLFFGANAIGLMVVSQVVGRLAHRVPPARMLPVAQAAAAVAGAALLLTATTGWGGFPALVATLFAFIASLGGIMPIAAALAMGPQGRVAGSASAVIGMTQFGVGALASLLVATLQDGTALPMALVVALSGVGGLIVGRLTPR